MLREFQVYDTVIQLFYRLCSARRKCGSSWSPHGALTIPLTAFPVLCLSFP